MRIVNGFTEVKRTVKNGNLILNDVPHWFRVEGLFPDGEKEALSGWAVYMISKMFKYMHDNNIRESSFDELKDKV